MERNRKKSNIFILSIFKKFNAVLFGFLATIFLHRLLTPELKGRYEYVNNIVVIMTSVLNLGISLVLPNYIRKNNDWTLSTFYVLSLCQFLIYTLISVIIGVLCKSVSIFLYGFAVACGVLSLQMLNSTIIYNFTVTVVANVLGVFTNAAILAAALILGKRNITVVFIALIAKELICSLICYASVFKQIKIELVKFTEWWHIVLIGFIPMLTSLLSIVNYRMDILEMRWLGVSDYDIGIYSVGLSLSEYSLLFADIFRDVLLNKTALNDDFDAINFSLKICLLLMLIFYIAMIFLGRGIIKLIYGSDYVGAYEVVLVILLGTFSMMYFKLLSPIFIAHGKWGFYFFSLLGGVVINIVSNLIFIPLIGIYGAAITSFLSYMFTGLMFIIKYIRSFSLKLTSLFVFNKNDYKYFLKQFKKGKINNDEQI